MWQNAQGNCGAVQVEAIRAGTQPGLTMVVGPPGTGKTDTAVQIMHVLYHNCPTQRTLLIAHSNQVELQPSNLWCTCCYLLLNERNPRSRSSLVALVLGGF